MQPFCSIIKVPPKMKTTEVDYTPIQLKSQVDMERIIEINDSVYTFNEVVSHIDLKNTLYCQEHGMEKYMKFPMYEKEIKDKKYRDDPYGRQNVGRFDAYF